MCFLHQHSQLFEMVANFLSNGYFLMQNQVVCFERAGNFDKEAWEHHILLWLEAGIVG